MSGGDLGISAFPEGDSIFTWIGTIEGGKGTIYEGLSYKLSLSFPLEYPFKPPQVKFKTLCFHPNVDQFGNICLDILQDKWSSAYDCRTILLSIQSLLGEPNTESPLNIYAATLWNNKEGWYSYYWLPFIPLIIILMVGTKLQVIITKMGLRIQDRGDVVKGAPLVQPGDDLFWFNRPRLILSLIHFVLFTNAFQLAFFVWSWYEFGLRSCFHKRLEDIIIRLSMGVIVQFLCSYVTLPLYALVTQMGSNMRPNIFSEHVAKALKNWHHTAKKHMKHGRHSENTTPFSSRPATPVRGMSPVHMSPVYLLHGYQNNVADSLQTSPRTSNVDNDVDDFRENGHDEQPKQQIPQPSSIQVASTPRVNRAKHEIQISLGDFSFDKR